MRFQYQNIRASRNTDSSWTDAMKWFIIAIAATALTVTYLFTY